MWACFLVSDLRLPGVCMAHPLALFVAPDGSGGRPSCVCKPQCLSNFALSLVGAVLYACTKVPYWFHTFSRWGRPVLRHHSTLPVTHFLQVEQPFAAQKHPVVSAGSICRCQGPVCACYGTPLSLLELALEGVARDMLQHPWRSARVPG